MRFRLLVSFLVGATFFTVLLFYASWLGLGTGGVVAGVALALVTGPARGFRLVLACAFVATSLYVVGFGLGSIEWMGEQPTIQSLFLSYLVLLPVTFVAYVALMPLAFAQLVFPAAAGVALMVLARSVLARLRRS